MNRALLVALVIAVFFLGSLTNQIASLKEAKSPDTLGAAAAPTGIPQQPQQAKAKPITASDHIKGNKNAKITLIEYSDFECPFCKNFEVTIKQVMDTYGDKIRLAYRHYPLGFHANAQKEAEASECVAELGGNDAFWKYAAAIYERTTANGTGFALDKLGPLAAEFGIDQTAFQTCLDSGKYEKLVKDSVTDGTASGVNGTPSTFIIDSKGNSQLIVGAQPIETFKTAIDKALAEK